MNKVRMVTYEPMIFKKRKGNKIVKTMWIYYRIWMPLFEQSHH